MKTKILFLLFLTACLCTTCKPSECLFSTGTVKKQIRNIAFFNKIVAYDNISLILTEEEGLLVEAGENLLPLVETTLQADSTLVLRNRAKCNWLRTYKTPIKVYVGAKNLNYIRWQSFGKLESSPLVLVGYLQIDILEVNALISLDTKAAGLYVFSNSGAAVYLSGESVFLSIFTMGFGKIDAQNLQAQKVSVKHQGQNDIWVKANQDLKATLESSGNLFYKLSDTASQNITRTASGKAIQIF